MYMFWKNNPYSGQKSMDLYNNQKKNIQYYLHTT